MKITGALFGVSLLSLILTACPLQDVSNKYVVITANRATIRVGEAAVLTLEYEAGPPGPLSRGRYGFIYSSPTADAPYLTDAQGNVVPEARPERFPVNQIVRIMDPPNAVANVSPLAPAQQDGRFVRTQFTIRGEQPGTATIKAGFVATLDSNLYGRMPITSTMDGSLQITVVE